MALYRAETKPISRKDGRSAVAAAAYRSGASLVDDRTGNAHDYTRRRGVVATGIITPDGQGCERNALWNGAEAAEKRKDARTAREWVLALPAELTDAQRQELTERFSRSLAERFGVAVDFAIHRPGREGDERNHHAHVLTTTRQVSHDASGALMFGGKALPEQSDAQLRKQGVERGAVLVEEVRALWEAQANTALEAAGEAARIDRRSLKARGIDRTPTVHLGPSVTALERRGRRTEGGNLNRAIEQDNEQKAALTAEIIDLQAERIRIQSEAARQVAPKPVRRERKHGFLAGYYGSESLSSPLEHSDRQAELERQRQQEVEAERQRHEATRLRNEKRAEILKAANALAERIKGPVERTELLNRFRNPWEDWHELNEAWVRQREAEFARLRAQAEELMPRAPASWRDFIKAVFEVLRGLVERMQKLLPSPDDDLDNDWDLDNGPGM